MNYVTLKKWALLVSGLILSLFFFSCAKQSERSVKKTTSQIVNPGVSNNSQQAQNSQGYDYQIVSLEHKENSTFVSEIKMFDGSYVPVTTQHASGQEAYGYLDDSQGQAKLDVRAGCFDNCTKYVLLVTVIKSNQSIHQLVAMSKKDKDFFWLEQVNFQVAQLYRDANGVTAVTQIYNKYQNLFNQ